MLTDTIVDARNAGVPLIAVTTADQMGAVSAICKATDGAPKVLWDVIRGLSGINDAGTEALAAFGDPDELQQSSTNPQTALEMIAKLPGSPDGDAPGSIAFMLNAHRFIEDPFFSTGVGNLRDLFKVNRRTLIPLGPGMPLPAELQQDVVVIDDPLPDDKALAATIEKLCDANDAPCPPDILERAVDATRGLSLFACEQVTAMSLHKTGVDLESLWDRKRSQVNQTKGLTLLKGGPTLDDVQGYDALDTFARKLGESPKSFSCVVWIDEIEKHFGGLGTAGGPGDNTGITQDQLGAFLRWTEERGHMGCIFVGGPGTGKSFTAQAWGTTFGRPTAMLDFGELKESTAGSSETNIRTGLKTIDGIAAGRALIIATCNKLDALPPELRRRFTLGIWYFDLPTAQEREAIWAYQMDAHDIKPTSDDAVVGAMRRPDDTNWTGAEIRNCCRIASQLQIPLTEAAVYIVPVMKSDTKSIESLRALATGRFLSASEPGTYKPKQEFGGARKVKTS